MRTSTRVLPLITAIMLALGCAESVGPEPEDASRTVTAGYTDIATRIVGSAVFVQGINADAWVAVNASLASDGTAGGRVTSPSYRFGGSVERVTHFPMNRIWCIQYRNEVDGVEPGSVEPDRFITLWIRDVGDGVNSFDEVGIRVVGGLAITDYTPCDQFSNWLHTIDRGDFKVTGAG